MLPFPADPSLQRLLAADYTIILGGNQSGSQLLATIARPHRLLQLRWNFTAERMLELVFVPPADRTAAPANPASAGQAIDELPHEVGLILALVGKSGAQLPLLWLPPEFAIQGEPAKQETANEVIVSLKLTS